MENFKNLVIELFKKRADEATLEYRLVKEASEKIKISANSEERP